jgi:hypothetical protein
VALVCCVGLPSVFPSLLCSLCFVLMSCFWGAFGVGLLAPRWLSNRVCSGFSAVSQVVFSPISFLMNGISPAAGSKKLAGNTNTGRGIFHLSGCY